MSTPDGGPPNPPPRRSPPSPPSPIGEQRTENAFTPSPDNAPVANPFLSEEVLPSAPQVVATATSGEALPVAGIAGAPAQEPIRPQAASPGVHDAHAEFRKGRWKGPVFGLLAVAAVAGGFFFLLPKADDDPVVSAPPSRDNAVIGSSVSPQVIEEPIGASESSPRAPAENSVADESPSNRRLPARSSDSGGFASAFKSSAN